MNKDILLYFALLLWFVVPVSAQPTIFVPTETVEPGSSVLVDFRVTEFDEIQSMQFSVNWDPGVLQFDSITNLNALPDYTIASFGTNSTHLGKLTTLWLDNQLMGVSLEDSTIIFSLAFTVLGESDSFSVIAISDDPTQIEFSDSGGNVLSVIIQNGMIIVSGIMSDSPTAPLFTNTTNELFTVFQNEPNPFENQSDIRFNLFRSNDVEFIFQSIDGKLVHSIKGYFLEGENSVAIQADKFPGPGTYLYTMKSNEYSITHKMVLLR